MTRALQVINTHAQLRAKFNESDTLIDEVLLGFQLVALGFIDSSTEILTHLDLD